MSFGSAKEFEGYARHCVNEARQADTPELRDMLLDLAREWMQAAIDEEQWAKRIISSYQPRTNDEEPMRADHR